MENGTYSLDLIELQSVVSGLNKEQSPLADDEKEQRKKDLVNILNSVKIIQSIRVESVYLHWLNKIAKDVIGILTSREFRGTFTLIDIAAKELDMGYSSIYSTLLPYKDMLSYSNEELVKTYELLKKNTKQLVKKSASYDLTTISFMASFIAKKLKESAREIVETDDDYESDSEGDDIVIVDDPDGDGDIDIDDGDSDVDIDIDDGDSDGDSDGDDSIVVDDPDSNSDIDGDSENDGYTEEETSKPETTVDKEIVNEDEAKLVKMAFNSVNGQLKQLINDIERIYSGLFESGYGVIEPQGLLCNGPMGGAFLHFDKDNYRKAVYESTMEFHNIWLLLEKRLGLRQSDSRLITLSQIKAGYNYFPKKLIEYAFGRYTSKEEDIQKDIYPKHSASVSWKKYWTDVIQKNMETDISNVFMEYIQELVRHDYLNKSRMDDFYSKIADLQSKIFNAYTPCIIVSENSDGKVKFRFSDVRKVRNSSSTSLVTRVDNNGLEFINSSILNDVGTIEKDLSKSASTASRINGFIKEVEIIRNSKLCGVIPLFAYTALDKLIEQGKKVSWQSIVVGRAEDDSIYLGNDQNTSNKYKLSTNTIVHISAGSRSGKGVMTLNQLASAYAAMIPVIYLDSKPDMSALIAYMAEKHGVKTMAINAGNYDPRADMGKVIERQAEKEKWSLPSSLSFNDISKDVWGGLKYIKALDFSMWLMTAVAQGRVKSPNSNLVVVADELQKALGKWQIFYEALHKLSEYNSDLDKKSKETEQAKAAGALIRWYYRVCSDWKSASKSSTKNINPTMFCIYQEHEISTWNSGGVKSKTDGDNRTANTMIYRALKTIGNAGFIGYDARSYGAKIAPPNSVIQPLLVTDKGKKYINQSDRYFAWVDDLDSQDVKGAEFVKPFLILNDTKDEDNPKSYVGEMKNQLKYSLTDSEIENVLKKHRLADGRLNPAIGFEGYIDKMAASLEGNYRFSEALASSYNIVDNVLNTIGYYKASGNNSAFDYFTDFRPDFMPSWDRLNMALKGQLLGSEVTQQDEGIHDESDGYDSVIGGGIVKDTESKDRSSEGFGSSEGLLASSQYGNNRHDDLASIMNGTAFEGSDEPEDLSSIANRNSSNGMESQEMPKDEDLEQIKQASEALESASNSTKDYLDSLSKDSQPEQETLESVKRQNEELKQHLMKMDQAISVFWQTKQSVPTYQNQYGVPVYNNLSKGDSRYSTEENRENSYKPYGFNLCKPSFLTNIIRGRGLKSESRFIFNDLIRGLNRNGINPNLVSTLKITDETMEINGIDVDLGDQIPNNMFIHIRDIVEYPTIKKKFRRLNELHITPNIMNRFYGQICKEHRLNGASIKDVIVTIFDDMPNLMKLGIIQNNGKSSIFDRDSIRSSEAARRLSNEEKRSEISDRLTVGGVSSTSSISRENKFKVSSAIDSLKSKGKAVKIPKQAYKIVGGTTAAYAISSILFPPAAGIIALGFGIHSIANLVNRADK